MKKFDRGPHFDLRPSWDERWRVIFYTADDEQVTIAKVDDEKTALRLTNRLERALVDAVKVKENVS